MQLSVKAQDTVDGQGDLLAAVADVAFACDGCSVLEEESVTILVYFKMNMHTKTAIYIL